MNIIILLLLSLLRKDFIIYKKRFNLVDKVQIHHIIPLTCKNNENIYKNNYDIDAGYNLMFMPNNEGKKYINTTRRIHDGGHMNYNKFVIDMLNNDKNPFEINIFLKFKIKNDEKIPW